MKRPSQHHHHYHHHPVGMFIIQFQCQPNKQDMANLLSLYGTVQPGGGGEGGTVWVHIVASNPYRTFSKVINLTLAISKSIREFPQIMIRLAACETTFFWGKKYFLWGEPFWGRKTEYTELTTCVTKKKDKHSILFDNLANRRCLFLQCCGPGQIW